MDGELKSVGLSMCSVPLSERHKVDSARMAYYTGWFTQNLDLEYPMKLRQLPSGLYEILEDPEILVAAELKGITSLSAIVSQDDYTRKKARQQTGRPDAKLDPIALARAYHQIIEDSRRGGKKKTQEDLSVFFGRSRSAVAGTLRLLKLTSKVQAMVERGELSEGHGRALCTLKNARQQVSLAERVMRENWDVRSLEKFVQGVPVRSTGKGVQIDPDLKHLEASITNRVGYPVTVTPATKSAGVVAIAFTRLKEGYDLLGSIEKRCRLQGDCRLSISLDYQSNQMKKSTIKIYYEDMAELQQFFTAMGWLQD